MVLQYSQILGIMAFLPSYRRVWRDSKMAADLSNVSTMSLVKIEPDVPP
jgi:hypothetical protein